MSNKKVNVTRREFQKSYSNHYQLYLRSECSPKTRRLILFYSVECGLKSLIMKEIGKNTYDELDNYCKCNGGKKLSGHDIKEMIKEVNPHNSFILKDIYLKNTGGSVPPCRYNELWRYGAEVADEKQEEAAERTLKKIAEWIKTRI